MHTENSEEIFDVIHTSMHLLRARQLRALRDSEVALTHMEARVLSFFDRHPDETLSTLTAHSGRDKGQLARLLANLRGYERWRKSEAARMLAAMEGLKRLFAGSNPLKKLVRGVGLCAVDGLGPLKQGVVRAAMGLEGELPALAKGEKI